MASPPTSASSSPRKRKNFHSGLQALLAAKKLKRVANNEINSDVVNSESGDATEEKTVGEDVEEDIFVVEGQQGSSKASRGFILGICSKFGVFFMFIFQVLLLIQYKRLPVNQKCPWAARTRKLTILKLDFDFEMSLF